jgi:hypothetical protein
MKLCWKIIASVSLVNLVVIASCLSFVYFRSYRIAMAEMRQNAENVATVFEALSQGGKDKEDRSGKNQLFQAAIDSLRERMPRLIEMNLYKIGEKSWAVASTDQNMLGKEVDPEDVEAAKQDKTVVLFGKEEGKHVVDVTKPLHFGERVYVAGMKMELDADIAQVNGLLIQTVIIGLLAMLLSLFVLNPLLNQFMRPIDGIAERLSLSAENLNTAAGQIAASSQLLSSGTSELASSVEETTSSMDELQSIIETNTRSMGEAERLMRETNAGAKDSSGKMRELLTAMGDISENSKKIHKVIKIIDDIAFQTNILALNAAVEAARAGESGRGFSVVAEQVKNLAQKSAVAVQDTADLVDRALESVERGALRGQEVKAAQSKAVELAAKVGTLLEDIGLTSREQLKNSNQVTQAMTQINSVVQGTATSSEETASASEVLREQANLMKGAVANLNSLMSGKAEASVSLASSNPGERDPF